MAAIPRSEFPRPDRIRNDWLCLNGEWDFALFPAGQEAQEADFARCARLLSAAHHRAFFLGVPAVRRRARRGRRGLVPAAPFASSGRAGGFSCASAR